MSHPFRVLACTVACCAVVAIPDATAQTVRVRTDTLGKATQFRRSDFSREAPRTFHQQLSIWAFDAAPGLDGPIDVHASARYDHDFGVAREDRSHPAVAVDRSRFILDVLELKWRPHETLDLVAGRQWVPSPLGMRDIDGARVRWTPRLVDDVHAIVDGYAGFDVASGWATVNADEWDVQGLPLPNDGSAPGGRRYGATTGIDLDVARLEVAWQRRDGVDGDETYLGEERVGAALRGNPGRRVAIAAAASYHVILDDVDRADLTVSWREPWAETVLSAGLEHRQPWFDSSSIFNVFGARPLEGAYVTYQVPVAAIDTSFEARTWARVYDGNSDLGDFGGGPSDERAVGAGLGHTTRFRAFGRVWRWTSYGSWQSSEDGTQGGTQWLADTRFEFPAIRDAIHLDGRFLGLLTRPGLSSRYGPGEAVTAVIGARVPASFGTFRVWVEGQSSSHFGGNTNAFASFESELWF